MAKRNVESVKYRDGTPEEFRSIAVQLQQLVDDLLRIADEAEKIGITQVRVGGMPTFYDTSLPLVRDKIRHIQTMYEQARGEFYKQKYGSAMVAETQEEMSIQNKTRKAVGKLGTSGNAEGESQSS